MNGYEHKVGKNVTWLLETLHVGTPWVLKLYVGKYYLLYEAF